MDKYQLTEMDICTKFITPALEKAGRDIATQVREEVPLTKGRIIVRGKLHTRAQNKRADYVLFHRPNMPIAVIEAKDNKHSLGDGMQLGLGYAEMLQVPFVFSSNGKTFGGESCCEIEHLFDGQAATADYYHQDPCVGGTKVVLKSDKDKTVFAQEVVPTLDGLWFEPFRPVFEFIKSKCVGGISL